MLFDLRATGRRRAVKIIYVFLAILMGGGLVFFGVGGSGFGLLNADQGGNAAGTAVSYAEQAQKAEKKALKLAEAAAAAQWASAAKSRFQQASAGFDTQTGQYSKSAQEQLKLAGEDWQQYLKTVPGKPDLLLSKLMAQAFGQGGLNQPTDAVKAWQIVVADESTAPNYSMLALSAYLAGDKAVSGPAAKRALELTPKAQRANLEAQFKAAQALAKAQAKAAARQVQQQQNSGGLGTLP